MNKNFRSVWNHCKQAFVAAAENVTSRGRPGGGVQRTLVVAALLGGLLLQAGQALAAPPAPSVAPAAPAAGQLPTGGQVSAGQAGIAQSGASMVITQGSERAAINWQSFSVGKGAQVQFQQPGISSVTLNRVQGSDPSQIFGRITANGQVILTNPSGVYFSPSARVDVGGLIATTHGIGDADFMAGQARFERNGSTAGVVNEGALQAALGGYIALLAPEVRNHGAVIAQMGTVALASGEAIDLRFDSNNRLTSLRVEPGQLQALVDNRHAVQAPGGLVILSAQSMDRLLGGVVKNSGSVEASGLQVQDGGRIVLSGSSRVDQAGTLTATSGAQGGHGGQVSLQGEQIVLTDGSRIDASGAQGGGSVRVGGGWQGSADPLLAATAQPTPAATTVTMAAGAHIDASATRAGDGGRVVLWSDVHKAESVTTAKGRVTARGGATGGNGGQVETSGHALDVDGIGVDAGAGAGQAGAWLLDPYNYTVNGSAAASIGNALNSTSVTVTTSVSNASQGGSSNSADAGDIVLASNLNKTATAGTTTLTLQAARRLNMNGYGIGSAAGGPLNLVLWSNAGGAALGAGSGGVSSLSSISTNGGFVWAGGGSATTTKSGVTVPNGPAIGGNNANHNPIDWSGAINTAGGDVMVWSGTGIGSNALTTYTGAAINAGSGNVTLRARDFNWVSGGNPAITTTGSITIRPDVDGGAFARGINTDWFNLGGATPSGVQFGAAGNTADVNLNQALTVAGPISVYGGNIYPNASLVSTASGASLLLKATGNIVNSTPNLSLRTHNGNLTLWADADGNSSGWIGIREGVTFNSANGATTQSTGGGAITLAGGSTTDANGLPTGHAYAPGGTGAWGSNAPSGVQLGAYTAGTAPGYANDIKFHSGGGNVVIKGKAADGAPGVSWYGGHAGTQVVDAGAGTITLDGQGVGTGHGIELSYFGGASSPTLKSGSNAATAIAISGSTTSTGHAGYQGTVSANASGSGGISLSGSTSASGSGAVVASNLGLAAASGDISISGVGGTGLNIGGTWGKGSLASSSSNITLTANQVSLSATTLDTTGRLTVQPDGSSFTSALTWPLANLTLSGTLGGLTLGKTTNTADITIANALTVNGPVSAWGGTVTAQGISAAGDITLVATGQDVLLNGAITNTAGSASALNIQAARHIRLGSNASITATNAAMASQLWADTDRNGDGIVYLTSSGVSTHGGDLTFGKSGQTATIGGSSVLVGGDVFVQRSSAQSLATGGGTLNVYGETIVANTAGLSVDTAGGDVNFRGLLNSGNAYSFVDMTGSAGTGSWDSARTAARNGTAGGAAIGDSYMVNIGSRLENQIAGLTAGYKGAWIGAWRSDPNSWAWTWADGPEAGRVFFNQNGSGGSATAGAYANFGTGEPNGGLNSSRSSVETVGQFFGTAGQWNDLGVNTTFSSNQGSQYNVLGYVRETNLAGSPVTINAGTGRVSFADRIGSSKALAALSVTAAGTTLPSVVTTTGQQTYNSPVRLAADTTLNTTQSDIVFQSTVDSDSAASPRSLTLNVTPGTAYYWVDWTSADATHVHGTITIGSNVINVTYTNENGYAFAQTSGGTNYWTSSNAVSPYTSAMVANGPSSADIVALRYAGNQSLSFSQPVENLAFSVVSLNGNGYGFNQNFNVESYTGANGAGSGYYGSGTLSKSQVGSTYQLNGSGEPHGTVRFANAFSSLNWNSLSPEFWNGFTVGVTGTSSNAGTVRFNGAAGSTAALGAVAVNAGLQTAANIGGAASLAVSGRTALGGNVTTSGSQSYASAVTLDRDVVLTTTSNGAVSTTATVDGARRLTVQTHGTGDTSFGGAVGGSTALTGLSVYTDAFNAGAIAVAAAAGVTITNAGTSAVTGVVSGTGATLAKAGAGSLSLSGTNTYAGATTVSGGTLAISADAGLGTAPAAATAGHLVLDGGTLLATASTTLASNRGIQLGSGNGTLSAASGATLSYGGVIAGSGGLSKDGAGALSLSGASTYTNTTTLNAGTVNTSHAAALGNNSAVTLANASGASLNLLADLAIGSLAGGGTTGGNVALNARTLTAGANNGSTSFGGVLSGTGGSLAKAGSGELVLTANSSYTGATAINGGSLVLRHNAPTVATSGFNGTGRLTVEPVAASFTSALGFSAPVSGSLSGLTLGKAGNGADITVASATSVNGPIAIHGGTVTLNAGLTTSNAGTGDVAITAATGLAGNGGVALANGRTLTIHQAGNTTYGGVISGSNANLVKDGAGDLGLAGASTHGGSTTVNAGILSLAAADRLPDSTALTVNAGATFSLNGYNESVGSIAGNGLIVNGAVVRDGLVLWLDAGNTASYSGSGTTWYDLSGNGYHGTLVGAPVYNASTSLFSFTSNAQYVQLPALPAGFLGNTVTGVTMFTVANFGTANNWERVFDLGNTGAGGNNPNHNIVISREGTGSKLNWEIYTGTSFGAPSENKIGANAAITDSVKRSYTGTADGANLRIYRDGQLNTTTASTALPVAVARNNNYIGKSNWQQDDTFRGDIGTLMVYNRALSQAEITKNHQLLFNRATATLSVGGNNTSTSFGGTIENGVGTLNLVKLGSGTLTLAGANSYAGTTTVSAGTLRNGAANVVPDLSPVTVAAGATWNLNGYNESAGSVAGAGSIALGAGTLTTGGLGTSTSFSGAMSGSGGITKTGAGTWTLTGTSSHSGATTVAAGTLASGAADSLSDASAITVAAGATLSLAGNSDSIGSLAGAGSVALGSATLTTGGDDTSTTFSGIVSGSNGNLAKSGSGTFTLTGANSYTGTTSANAGTLAVGNGGASGTLGSGAVTSNATLAFNRSGSVSLSTLLPHAGGITGSGTVTATAATDLTVDRPVNVAGAVTLTATAGSLAINSAVASGGTATLAQAGTLTDGASGSIAAASLRLQGGNVTLDNAANAVGTLAASGVGSLTYSDSDTLTIGTAGGTSGVSASGTVSIATRSGDLTLAANVATSSTSASALVLNAGSSAAAGTASGGNLVASGSPSVSVGAGGTARLYTGSIAGTSLGGLAGPASGSGRFRYGSDEASSAYSTALATGLNAIFRERPAVTVGVDSQAITYGDGLPSLTGTLSGSLANGDSASYAIAGRVNASSGNIRAGSYTLSEATLAGLGYSTSATTGTLTVAQRPLTLTGLTASDKVYDRSTAASVSNLGSLSGRVGGDTATLNSAGASASFADANAGSNKTVTVSGLALAGADAGNYSLAPQTTTATITPKALTVSGITAADKVYDATTAATISTAGLALSGLVAGDAGAVTLTGASGSFDTKNVGNGKTVSLSYTTGGSALANYRITDQAQTTASVTPATLTLSGASGVSKTYDGNDSLPAGVAGYVSSGAGSLAGVLGSDTVGLSGRGAFASANVARDGGSNVIAQGLLRGSIALSGADAGNYTLAWTNGSATIQPAPLTVRADNDARFVLAADPVFSVSYSGFVNGETAAVLTSTPTVTRPNAATDVASGSYPGALQVAGAAAANYAITHVAGDFTIVPASQLLVRVANGSSTYGTAPAYTIASASYWDPTANGGAGGEVVLGGITANGGNSFTVDDGASGSAVITLAPVSPLMSTSGALRAGSWQLDLAGPVGGSSANFSSTVTVVGAHQVNQATLNAVVNTGAKTKVYDASAAMMGLALDAQAAGAQVGDTVTLGASGSFDDKNASIGAGKGYTVAGIVLDGADAGNYRLAGNSVSASDGQITPRPLRVSYSGVDRVYDAGTSASVTTQDDRLAGDSLGISRSASFADKHVARDGSGNLVAKAVTVSGVSLTGADAGNYTVAAGGSTTATISPAPLAISGIVGVDKTYDRTTSAVLDTSGVTRTGLLGSDTVTVTPTGSFADVHAGAGRSITLASSHGGADAGNYSITDQAATTASVLRRPVEVSAAGGISKLYDGNTAMSGVSIAVGAVNGVAASGVVGGDSLSVSGTGSFSSAAVSRDGNGTVLSNKSYTLSNLTLSGASAADYMIAGGATTLSGSDGRIDPRTLGLSGFAVADKVYDGGTAATITSAGSLSGLVSGDVVSTGNTGASFASANAGHGRTATLNGVSLAGADAGNYVFDGNPVTASANISRATLTISGSSAAGKTYDGSTSAAITVGTLVGLVGSETLLTTATGSLDSANAGSRTATAQYTLADGSGLAANYTLADTTHAVTVAPKALSISGSNAANKTYDGSSAAAITVGTLAGLVGSETLGTTATGTLDSANAGSRTATAQYVLADGSGQAANYTLADTTHAVIVAPKPLTLSGLGSVGKVYDGSTVATVTGTAAFGTEAVGSGSSSDGKAYLGDALSLAGTAEGRFDSRHAGVASRVAFSGLALAGAAAANYVLVPHADATDLTISARPVTLTPSAVTRVYDGQVGYTANAADLQGLSAQLGVAGDRVVAADLRFDSKNVGSGKTATLNGVTIDDGNGGRNHAPTLAANSASSITRLAQATWIGGASGSWFDPANWAGGAVPDLSNVAQVVFPAGTLVNFDTTVLAPAQAGPVAIDGLAGGRLAQSAGTLQVGAGGITLAGLAQTGGGLASAGPVQLALFSQQGGSTMLAGPLRVTRSFSQTGGTLAGTGVGAPINITQADGTLAWTDIRSSGDLVVQAPQGSIAAGASVVAGNLLADAGGAITFGSTRVAGDLRSTTRGAGTAGGVSQSGVIEVGGTTQFVASGGTDQDARLDNPANRFGGTVSFSRTDGGSWRNLALAAAGNLAVAFDADGQVNLGAGGDLTVAGNAGSLTTASGGSTTFGPTTVSGDLRSSSGGDITQTGPLRVGGSTLLGSGGNITLADPANHFAGTVTASGRDISLAAANGLSAVIDASGRATLDAGGDLTVAGSAASLATTSGGRTTFGPTTVSGDLRSSSGGDITQTGPLRVGGSTTLASGNGNVTLADPANDFVGTVTASGRDISLADANALALVLDASGQATVSAGGNLALSGNAGRLGTTSGGTTSFGPTTVSGDLRSSAGGDISQTGPLHVGGGTTLASGNGNVTLADPANHFGGTVTASGRDITLAAANGLSAVIDASGRATLGAGGDLTVAGSAGSLTTASVGSTTFGPTTVSGDLRSSSGGDITQTGPLRVGGSTTLASGNGNVTLADPANHFAGTVTASGRDITLAAANGLSAVIDASGRATLDAGGDLTVAGSAASLATTSGGRTSFGPTTVSGDLRSTSGGDITQTGPLRVGGSTQLGSGGDVMLAMPGNDFVGAVSVTGGNVNLADANGLTLATLLARGDLRLTSHGALTLGTVSVGGALFADSGDGDITQTGPLQLGGFATLVAGLGQVVLTDPGNRLPLGSRIEASRYTLAGDARRTSDEASAKAVAGQSAAVADSAGSTPAATPPQPLALSPAPATSPSTVVASADVGTATAAATSTGTSSSSSSSAATAAPGANSAGVQIVVQAAADTASGVMAAVSLPKGTATAGVGFSFELPESVRALVQDGDTARVSLPSGAALQPWLRFDANTLRFDATAVPDGAFPLQVVVSVGGQRVLVVISERND